MHAVSTPKNFTRRSRSIPRKLLREGSAHLVPLYYLLRLSDLAREGIDHSGSFRFADHIYRGIPSGRTAFGRMLDARLLSMPAAAAFRRRATHAADVVLRALASRGAGAGPVRVLAVPCGIPRDIINVITALKADAPSVLARLDYHGVDIDPCVLDAAVRLTEDCGLASIHYHLGDALVRDDYPAPLVDVVVSTGLGEFLNDDELTAFYGIVHDVMRPGATFYTSATARDHRSDVLLRMVELETYYRRASDVERIIRQLPWSSVALTGDPTGLQTFITAVK
jgi:SAM-dependent methyltransferase